MASLPPPSASASASTNDDDPSTAWTTVAPGVQRHDARDPRTGERYTLLRTTTTTTTHLHPQPRPRPLTLVRIDHRWGSTPHCWTESVGEIGAVGEASPHAHPIHNHWRMTPDDAIAHWTLRLAAPSTTAPTIPHPEAVAPNAAVDPPQPPPPGEPHGPSPSPTTSTSTWWRRLFPPRHT